MSCVTREIVLPLETEEAWDALCDLEEWLADEADVLLEPGEEGDVRLADGEERRVRVDEVVDGERLGFWWWAEDAEPSFVELTLAPAVGGTRVRVVESGGVTGPVAGALMAFRAPAYA